jgi:NAD(P)-dependent dehydrogenase (short-subunit alcohol dehydrogenase family)
MSQKAALITGASSGIGLAIAHLLGEEGFSLTVSARRPDKLERAAAELRDAGYDVHVVPANMQSEEDIVALFESHREARGRLDVLVNNAGVGLGTPVADITGKGIDMQMDVNFKAIVVGYREGVGLLREAAAEHGSALVVNTSSISGKHGQGWLSVYSATKAAVVGFTEAMNKELGAEGIKSTALCPAFVETPMTEFAVDMGIKAEEMMRPSDIAEAVRMLLRQSRACIVPEVMFIRPGEAL